MVNTNSDSANREKVCHLRIFIYIWNYYGLTWKDEGVYRDDIVDEIVTVIILSVIQYIMYIPRGQEMEVENWDQSERWTFRDNVLYFFCY